jgi:predicted nuclease with RNAse H fold
VADVWAGVDVGGPRKGFHAAVVDERGVVAGPLRLPSVPDAVTWLAAHRPALTAVDSPMGPAPAPLRWRACEVNVRRSVCGIRWTPSQAALAANRTYYGWILHGLELYEALRAEGLAAIECFPTAAFTRWAGTRPAGTSRAAWTRRALDRLGLENVPPRTGQDGRDALAAAVTARLHARGLTESFGEIVVPLPSSLG